MSWKQLLAKGEVKAHQTSKQELDNIRALIARDLADAALTGLSADRRFATAYNAALQTAKIVIACSGYRVSARAGHHAVTFEAAHLAIGSEAASLTDYFDACRRKRNMIDYDNSSVATETEADELLRKADEFRTLVERWVATNHTHLSRS
jgi:uncharacterized protein (UPF0332 family)